MPLHGKVQNHCSGPASGVGLVWPSASGPDDLRVVRRTKMYNSQQHRLALPRLDYCIERRCTGAAPGLRTSHHVLTHSDAEGSRLAGVARRASSCRAQHRRPASSAPGDHASGCVAGQQPDVGDRDTAPGTSGAAVCSQPALLCLVPSCCPAHAVKARLRELTRVPRAGARLAQAELSRPAAAAGASASGVAEKGCAAAACSRRGTRSQACAHLHSALVDWETLGFGLTPTAAMYVATCARGQEVRPPRLLCAAADR